jgi:hypothetical protein
MDWKVGFYKKENGDIPESKATLPDFEERCR